MNDLVPISAPALMPVRDVERIAAAFAQSRMFGVSDANAALSLCLLAQAEGQHPAIAFRDYSIIQGKPAKKAEAMQRDFLQSGGKIEWLQLDDTCVSAKFTHPAGGSATIEWTMDRATKAGLGSKDMWKKWPRQMLRSRVISEGVRTVCPMATSGLYVPEEVRDFDNAKEPAHDSATGEIIEGNFEETGDVRDPKIPGITKIRNNLNKLRRDGGKATDLETFNALVRANADDLAKIRDAHHSLWTGMGEDFDGFNRWIRRRRDDLTPKPESAGLQLLLSLIQEATSYGDLSSILDEHDDTIQKLEGEESRRFELAYNNRESDLQTNRQSPTPLEAGVFGG